MKWFPLSCIEMVESVDCKYRIRRRVYSNGERSSWWIDYKESPEAERVSLLRLDSSLWVYKTLEEAQRRVEYHRQYGH